MRLIRWLDLARLDLTANTDWLVCQIPHDEATWRVGLCISPRMNRGRLRPDEFGLDCRTSANPTLSRRLPGRRLLKTLFRVLDGQGCPRGYACPHVGRVVPTVATSHGPMSFEALRRVFEALVWV
jgi:hypothetical protein